MRIEDAMVETSDRATRGDALAEPGTPGFDAILARLRRLRRRSHEGAAEDWVATTPTTQTPPPILVLDDRVAAPSILDRIERAARLAMEDPAGPGVATTIRLRNGAHVELAIRAHALGVEIRLAAPSALAAALLRDRLVLDARLAARGIRLRSCRIRRARFVDGETESERA